MKLDKRRVMTFVCALVILSTVLSSCQLGPRSAAPTVAPSPGTAPPGTEESTPRAQELETVATRPTEPLPPQVIQVTPAPGEELPLDAPLQVIFDQPMDANSVQAAFIIAPAVAGDFEWPFPHVMRFRPVGAGFERATRYTATLEDTASSQAGMPLKEAVQFRFDTVGFLEVAAVQPADGTAEVAT